MRTTDARASAKNVGMLLCPTFKGCASIGPLMLLCFARLSRVVPPVPSNLPPYNLPVGPRKPSYLPNVALPDFQGLCLCPLVLLCPTFKGCSSNTSRSLLVQPKGAQVGPTSGVMSVDIVARTPRRASSAVGLVGVSPAVGRWTCQRMSGAHGGAMHADLLEVWLAAAECSSSASEPRQCGPPAGAPTDDGGDLAHAWLAAAAECSSDADSEQVLPERARAWLAEAEDCNSPDDSEQVLPEPAHPGAAADDVCTTPPSSVAPEDQLCVVARTVAHVRQELGSVAALCTDLPRALDLMVELSDRGALASDGPMVNACTRFLSEPCPIASQKMVAARYGVDAKRFGTASLLAVEAVLSYQERSVSDMLQGLLTAIADSPEIKLLSVCERSKYDETPMFARTLSATRIDLLPRAPLTPQSGGEELALPVAAAEFTIDASPAKLFQSELTFGFLLQVNGSYIALHMPCATPVQTLERSTAECILQALREHTPPVLDNPVVPEHIRLLRVATTDRAKGNLRAERAWAAARPNVTSLLSTCDVHRISTLRDVALRPMAANSRGLLHFSLSLRDAGAVPSLRKSMRQVLAERFVFRVGAPPPLCVERQNELARLLLGPHRPSNAVRAFALKSLANGDWREGQVVHWCSSRCVCGGSAQRCLVLMQTVLVSALLPRAPPLFPRHRWTSGEETAESIGLLLAVHNLGQAAYEHWCQDKAKGAADGRRQQHAPPSDGRDAIEGLAGGANPGASLGDPPGMFVDGQPPRDAADAIPEVEEQEVQRNRPFEGESSNHRAVALSWLATSPLGDLLVMRAIMEPQRIYMSAALGRSGDVFETKRSGRVAQGLGATQGRQPQDYRVLSAASATLEQEFIHGLREVLARQLTWQALPVTYSRVHTVNKAFKMGSASLCSVYSLMIWRYEAHLYKTFRGLLQPTVFGEIREDCPHRKDEWTLGLEAAFNGNLGCSEAIAHIEFAAGLVDVDIAQIERGHATMRRVLVVRSPNTHACTVRDLSAHMASARPRKHATEWQRRQTATEGSEAEDSGQDGDAEEAPPAKARRTNRGDDNGAVRHGGGAWRAFVHVRVRGHRGPIDWAALALQYWALSPEERQAFERMGRDATDARRLGCATPFGRKPSQVELERRRDNLARVVEDMASRCDDPSSMSDTALATFMRDGQGLQWLHGPRQILWAKARLASHAARTRSHMVDQWLLGPGAEILARLADGAECLRILCERQGLDAIALHHAPSNFQLAKWCDWRCIVRRAATAVACFGPSTSTAQVKRTMVAKSHSRHRVIMHDDCPQIQVPKETIHPCQMFHRCVCSIDGRRARAMLQRLSQKVKQWVKPGTMNRQALAQHDLLLRLRSVEASAAEDDEACGMWWHIGHACLSPWHLVCQLVHALDDPRLPSGEAGKVFRMSGVVADLLQVCQDLDAQLAWMVELWQLSESLAPVHEFDPQLCWARKVDGTGEQFWPPPRRARNAWRQAVADIIDGPDSDEGADEGDGGSDGGAEDAPHAASEQEGGALEEAWVAAAPAVESDADDEASVQDVPTPSGAPEPDADTVASVDADRTAGAQSRAEEEEDLFGMYLDDPAGVPQGLLAPRRAPPASSCGSGGGHRMFAAQLQVDGGTLKLYGGNGNFEAICNVLAHGRCSLTRTGAGGRRPAQGRPIGLICWLAAGSQHATKASHRAMPPAAHAARVAARRALRQLPEATPLFEVERPPRDGEQSEPEQAP